MGGGGEGEMEVWSAAEGFEEEGDAGEGFGGGEVEGLEGGLFGEEEGAGDGELGPGVEDFGGLVEEGVRMGLGRVGRSLEARERRRCSPERAVGDGLLLVRGGLAAVL